MIKITKEDFNIDKELADMKDSRVGGIVTFIGVVRGNSQGKPVNSLDIEVYPEMAYTQLREIRDEAISQFGLDKVKIVHRYGKLNVGDNIVLIAVASSHREEAFTGCRYIIDELKRRVPIWKKEHRPDGEHWVEGETSEQ
jgi:molybdopterin synthase catalytic subunit